MLVCFVSARPRGKETTAEIVEAAEASDGLTSGFVIFSALVDDPASVHEIVDAFFGDIMVEAATAADEFSTGLAFAAAIDEAETAAAAQDASISGAIVGRSAMVAGLCSVFVNPSGAREANVIGTMVNL
jgi:hypothetical protein